MKVLVKFSCDCGRMGTLDGLFVTTRNELAAAYGKEAIFGDVLGKHSEILVVLSTEYLSVLSDDQELIAKLEELARGHIICGYDPLGYIG